MIFFLLKESFSLLFVLVLFVCFIFFSLTAHMKWKWELRVRTSCTACFVEPTSNIWWAFCFPWSVSLLENQALSLKVPSSWWWAMWKIWRTKLLANAALSETFHGESVATVPIWRLLTVTEIMWDLRYTLSLFTNIINCFNTRYLDASCMRVWIPASSYECWQALDLIYSRTPVFQSWWVTTHQLWPLFPPMDLFCSLDYPWWLTIHQLRPYPPVDLFCSLDYPWWLTIHKLWPFFPSWFVSFFRLPLVSRNPVTQPSGSTFTKLTTTVKFLFLQKLPNLVIT